MAKKNLKIFKRLRGRSQNYNNQILIYSFSKHLFYLTCARHRTTHWRYSYLSKSWMVPPIKKVLVLSHRNRQQTCEHVISIKSLFKGTPKERKVTFKDVSEKQCLFLYLMSSAHITLVGWSLPHL